MEFALWVMFGLVALIVCLRVIIMSAYEIAKAICKLIETVYKMYYKVINAFKVVFNERKKKA